MRFDLRTYFTLSVICFEKTFSTSGMKASANSLSRFTEHESPAKHGYTVNFLNLLTATYCRDFFCTSNLDRSRQCKEILGERQT